MRLAPVWGHMGLDRRGGAQAPFAYPAMPAVGAGPSAASTSDRPDPRLRAAFLGLAVLGLVAVFAPVLALVLALVGAAVAVPLRHTRALRPDEASLRPWPHVARLPAPLAGTELLDADSCAVVWHRPTGLMSATVLLAPCPTALREPAVAEYYAACWWALLDSACKHPEIQAAAITVDVLPGGAQHPLRLTLTVDPAVRGPAGSVARAAGRTLRALQSIDISGAGLVLLRAARPADLARITRAALEPRCRWVASDGEAIAWGELAPGTEVEQPRIYRHEQYGSVSWGLHVPPGQHPRAEAVPALLRPGRHPRRVTLVERQDRRSVFVTASVTQPAEMDLARTEVEDLVRTVQPRLELCSDQQAAAFAVGLPVGWFPPHPVPSRYEVSR